MRFVFTLVEMMRPKQWVKNLFVLAPLIFSRSFLDPQKIWWSVYAFCFFSLAAGCVYILNDIIDLPYDRLHSLKKKRPLARGAISPFSAGIAALFLTIIVLVLSFLFSKALGLVLVSYLGLNILYTFWLKHLILLDMFSVALGFVLRVIAGIVTIGVFTTPWILGAAFFLALFIVSTKRFFEFSIIEQKEERRSVAKFYTPMFLRQVMFASLVVTLVVFILYAFLEVKSGLFLVAILPVTYGLLRLVWLVEVKEIITDNPTDIFFQDKHLQLAVFIFIFIIVSVFILQSTPYAALIYPFSK